MPSFGMIGDGLDHAMMQSFWASMQNELLDQKRWKTRLELPNVIFDYVEVSYNRQRRHSLLDYVSPVSLNFRSRKLRLPDFKTELGCKTQRRSYSLEFP